MSFRSLLRGAILTSAATILMCFGAVSAWAQHYQQTNLVSNVPGLATFTDPDLVNAWGVSHSVTSPRWVSDNGTGKATLYNAAGVKQGLVVTIPPAPGPNAAPTGTPTGQVFNSSNTDFAVSAG